MHEPYIFIPTSNNTNNQSFNLLNISIFQTMANPIPIRAWSRLASLRSSSAPNPESHPKPHTSEPSLKATNTCSRDNNESATKSLPTSPNVHNPMHSQKLKLITPMTFGFIFYVCHLFFIWAIALLLDFSWFSLQLSIAIRLFNGHFYPWLRVNLQFGGWKGHRGN